MTSIKNTQTVHLFDVTTMWTRLASGYSDYINNGNVDIYLQRQKQGIPESTDEGVRIRPGGRFITHPGEDEITFLRTLAGTSQVAKYQDLNNGAGTTSLTDPDSGNQAKINELGQLHTVMRSEVDTGNTSTTLLDAGEAFIGTVKESLDYAEISVAVYSDVDSAIDGLCVDYSNDGTTFAPNCGDRFTIKAGMEKTFSFQPQRRYFRVSYTNGATPQTAFNLETLLRKTRGKPSSHRIQDMIVADDDAELVKAVLTGQNPDDLFVNFKATRNGNFKVSINEYGDTPAIDAFSRLRVSNPITLFDSKQLHDKQELFWDELLGGNATSTHSATNALTRLAVTATAGDFAIRQTKMRFNYAPGKGQLAYFTFYNEQEAGLIKRCGLFDGIGVNFLTPNNGIFYETNEALSWNIAKNGVVTEHVAQANWNVDTLDGSGDESNPSGLTLNNNAGHIGVIDFEWLSIGRVRCGFMLNGMIVYTHYFNHANDPAFQSAYMSTPNLPVRYDIQTDGTAAGYLDHICSSVMSEGGREDTGALHYKSTEGTHIDANVENTLYALLGIRLKSGYLDAAIKMVNLAIQIQTPTNQCEWVLKINPTVAGTFAYVDQPFSAVQIAQGALANTITGGYDITGGFTESGGQQAGAAGSSASALNNAILLGSKIDGTPDTMVLCLRPINGSTGVDAEASMTWRELT